MKQRTSLKRIYKTPGRTCEHTDGGCCPNCMNPLQYSRRRISGFHMRMPKGIRKVITHNNK